MKKVENNSQSLKITTKTYPHVASCGCIPGVKMLGYFICLAKEYEKVLGT